MWGGDYVAIYKQALRYGMFKKMKFATTLAFGVAPARASARITRRACIAGVHSNYYFNYPPANRWPLNNEFVKKYYDRWKEYPNFQAEGAYTTLYMLKTAIEKANKLDGRLAGRRRDHQPARGPDASPGRRATSTSARTTTRATRTR